MAEQFDLFASLPVPMAGQGTSVAGSTGFVGLYSLSAVASLACGLGWYGTFSQVYISLTRIACTSLIHATLPMDAVTGRGVVWEWCSAHRERLTLCHGCGVRPISPYCVMHLCQRCIQADVVMLNVPEWEVIDEA
jgi:hypothetical protein